MSLYPQSNLPGYTMVLIRHSLMLWQDEVTSKQSSGWEKWWNKCLLSQSRESKIKIWRNYTGAFPYWALGSYLHPSPKFPSPYFSLVRSVVLWPRFAPWPHTATIAAGVHGSSFLAFRFWSHYLPPRLSHRNRGGGISRLEPSRTTEVPGKDLIGT